MTKTRLLLVAALAVAAVACGDDDASTDTGALDAGTECPAGQLLCGRECADTQLDPANCGGCAVDCAAGELCSMGTCGLSCVGGTTRCGDACVDTASDPVNCGGCGAACAPGELCSAGACSLSCGGGSTQCGDRCVDTMSDPANCGGCDAACPRGELCLEGTCAQACPAPNVACGDRCVDTGSNPDFCGACDVACAAGEFCTDGVCATECPVPNVVCGDRCVDTASNPDFCGACDVACGSTEACLAGRCLPLEQLDVLVYSDDETRFDATTHPVVVAAAAVGFVDVTLIFDDEFAFEAARLAGDVDLLVVDASLAILPDEVLAAAEARARAELPLVFSYWNLDNTDAAETSLRAALGVTTRSYSVAEGGFVTAGADPNLFTFEETVTSPMAATDRVVDDGDYLDLTGAGDVLFSAGGAAGSDNLGVLTNRRTSLVLGFLLANLDDSDVDADGIDDVDELMTNILAWFAAGRP